MFVRTTELSSYIEALRPIIYINHSDFDAVDRIIKDSVGDTEIYEFNNASGRIDFKSKNQMLDCGLKTFLDFFITDSRRPAIVVLKDIHDYFSFPEIISAMKAIAQRTMCVPGYYVTLIIVSTRFVIPPELEQLITVYDIPHPSQDEIVKIINKYADAFGIFVEEMVMNDLVVSFRGLSEFEIRQILNLAYQKSGMIDGRSKELILKEKEQIIRKSGMLETVIVKDDLQHVGGLDNLKKYLKVKSTIFNRLGEARKNGVDAPKGILIVGMPVCGKSLTAKVAAKQFGVPLLRLDVGKLMGKYVGESEENLRRAIKTAEAVSPCILWIDELEKAFAGIGGSGGASDVTTRLFGNFLTWLQEKESTVYVVATSNDISKLPAEFLRKGRFDELFFVDLLPNDEERKEIFEIHLRKRGKLTRDVDTIKLIKESAGFSGADIESVVKDAIEEAFIEEWPSITTEQIINISKKTKSLSITLKEKIKDMRDRLDKYDFQPATKVK